MFVRSSTTLAVALVALSPTLVWGQASAPASAPTTGIVGTDAAREAARALAIQGIKLYEGGQYLESMEWFRKADALYPAPQYRIYLGRAYAKLGKLGKAVDAYNDAIAMVLPPGAPTSTKEAQRTAAEELAELHKRFPAIRVRVTGAPARAVQITVNGKPVGDTDWPRIELEAGHYDVVATAAGYEKSVQSVDLRDGATETVAFVLRPIDGAPSAAPDAGPDAAPATNRLSHRMQLGGVARLDIDPLHKGVRTATGLTFGVIDHLEFGALALLGRTVGLELAATAFVLKGAYKPFFNVGMPIFITGGPHLGVRGAAGFQWDPIRYFGVFAQVGGAYFPAPPEPVVVIGRPLGPTYDKAVFLPAVGVQGRFQ